MVSNFKECYTFQKCVTFSLVGIWILLATYCPDYVVLYIINNCEWFYKGVLELLSNCYVYVSTFSVITALENDYVRFACLFIDIMFIIVVGPMLVRSMINDVREYRARQRQVEIDTKPLLGDEKV